MYRGVPTWRRREQESRRAGIRVSSLNRALYNTKQHNTLSQSRAEQSRCDTALLEVHVLVCARLTFNGSEDYGVGRHGPRKPEITEFECSVGANQDVLRLHVAVNDPVRVQVVQGLDQLLGDHAHCVFRQGLVVLMIERRVR